MLRLPMRILNRSGMLAIKPAPEENHTLNWTNVGSTPLASLGVIASLVFVGLQIQQNTAVAQAQTRRSNATGTYRKPARICYDLGG